MKLKSVFKILGIFAVVFAAARSHAGSYGKLSPINGTDASYVVAVTAQSIPGTASELFEISGSASKVVRIQEITVDTTNSPSYGSWTYFNIFRRSTAATGGTSTSITPAKLDTNNSAASVGSSKYFSAAPTAGTLVDTLARVLVSSSGGPTYNSSRILFKADTPSQAITLRGTSDFMTVAVGANVYNNGLYGNYSLTVKFTESAN